MEPCGTAVTNRFIIKCSVHLQSRSRSALRNLIQLLRNRVPPKTPLGSRSLLAETKTPFGQSYYINVNDSLISGSYLFLIRDRLGKSERLLFKEAYSNKYTYIIAFLMGLLIFCTVTLEKMTALLWPLRFQMSIAHGSCWPSSLLLYNYVRCTFKALIENANNK